MITDSEANEKLIDTAIQLANDDKLRITMSENISKLAFHNASEKIAKK